MKVQSDGFIETSADKISFDGQRFDFSTDHYAETAEGIWIGEEFWNEIRCFDFFPFFENEWKAISR